MLFKSRRDEIGWGGGDRAKRFLGSFSAEIYFVLQVSSRSDHHPQCPVFLSCSIPEVPAYGVELFTAKKPMTI